MKCHLINLLVTINITLFPVLLFTQQNVPAKFALVIGNGNYANISKLNNPVNDANDMADTLQSLGFHVEKILNGSLDQIEEGVIKLKNRLSASKNSYGFLFYAGHGVQSNGENFLIPADVNIQSESFLRLRTVSVQALLDELNEAGNDLNVVVLDACRDNPFSWRRSSNRGLTPVGYQPADSIIVFATSAGSTAADGTGRNGLFTGFLLNHLKTPGLEVTEVFRKTMGDVANASGNMQRPAVYNQFSGVAYLGEPPATIVQVQPSPQPLPALPVGVQRAQKEKPSNAATKLWTVGASMGSSFAAPWLIGTVHGTIAPFRYSFLEIGFDAGFISGATGVSYYSFYPFAHVAFFMPFVQFTGKQSTGGGFYIGLGGGYMMSKYDFPRGDLPMQKTFAMDAIAGVNLLNMIDISYTFRTSFSEVNSKISIGYSYRFK